MFLSSGIKDLLFDFTDYWSTVDDKCLWVDQILSPNRISISIICFLVHQLFSFLWIDRWELPPWAIYWKAIDQPVFNFLWSISGFLLSRPGVNSLLALGFLFIENFLWRASQWSSNDFSSRWIGDHSRYGIHWPAIGNPSKVRYE